MKTPAHKTALHNSKAVANTSSNKQDKRESEVQFEDSRSEVIAQRKLKEMADNSPQAGNIAQMQAMANGASTDPVQRQESEGDEELPGEQPELLQRVAKEEEIQTKSAVAQKKDAIPANNTVLPDTLKSGIEGLSGLSMDDVKVHYNSAKPAQLQAHAFAQGTDIHMAPGQEKHLPHEAWHVVQQKQGRVKPTKQLKGKVNVNDDAGLEKEADIMATKVFSKGQVLPESGYRGGDSGAGEIPGDIDKYASKEKGISNRTNSDTAQLQTLINHTSTEIEWNGKKSTVGAKVEANLDPDEKVLGSAVAPGHEHNTPIDKLVAKYNSGSWARGHLLNHDLGGLGVPKNLFPITKGANRRHAHYVEYRVKDALAAAKEANKVAKVKDSVFYKVEVRGNPSDAQFVCEWQYRDKDGKPKQVEDEDIDESEGKWIIPSKLKGPESKGPATDPYNNSPKELPAIKDIIWFHGKDRKGTQNVDPKKVKWENDKKGLAETLTDEKAEEQKFGIADGSMTEEELEKYGKALEKRMLETLKGFCEERIKSAITSEVATTIYQRCYPVKKDWRKARPKENLKEDYKIDFANATASMVNSLHLFIENPEVREKLLGEEDELVDNRQVLPLFKKNDIYIKTRDELAEALIVREEAAKIERQKKERKKKETADYSQTGKREKRKSRTDDPTGKGGRRLKKNFR